MKFSPERLGVKKAAAKKKTQSSSIRAKDTSLHIIEENLGESWWNLFPWKKRLNFGTSKTVTARDLKSVSRKLRGKPGQTTKATFTASRLPHVTKTTRNRLIGTMASIVASLKLPSLMPRHRSLRFEGFWKYMTLNMRCVLFTDRTRAILDGPDGWSNGWVYYADKRQQQGLEIVIDWGQTSWLNPSAWRSSSDRRRLLQHPEWCLDSMARWLTTVTYQGYRIHT